jgi:hypothetical protein
VSADLDDATKLLAASSRTADAGAEAVYLAEARLLLARERARLDELDLLLAAREAEIGRRGLAE